MPLKEKSKRGSGAGSRGLIWWKLKRHGRGVTVRGEAVDPGAAGIAEAEQLGDLVVGLAGGVIDGAADVAVAPGACFREPGKVEVSMAAGDDQGEQGVVARGRVRGLHEDGVDVALEVVDRDERLAEPEGERLAYRMPTSRAPARPGPSVTATASSSAKATPA